MTRFSLKEQGNEQVSANFKVREFRSKCGSDEVLIDVVFVQEYLQKIRDHFGRPITVTSGYRTEAHNARVSGSKGSLHLQGRAFDISINGGTPRQIAQYAESLGIQGIIQYPRWCHVDSRTTKYFSQDSGRSAINSFA